jgi:hypothetical protein
MMRLFFRSCCVSSAPPPLWRSAVPPWRSAVRAALTAGQRRVVDRLLAHPHAAHFRFDRRRRIRSAKPTALRIRSAKSIAPRIRSAEPTAAPPEGCCRQLTQRNGNRRRTGSVFPDSASEQQQQQQQLPSVSFDHKTAEDSLRETAGGGVSCDDDSWCETVSWDGDEVLPSSVCTEDLPSLISYSASSSDDHDQSESDLKLRVEGSWSLAKLRNCR